MFGLKIVKEQDLNDLRSENGILSTLAKSKDAKIDELNKEISSLNTTIDGLREEIKTLTLTPAEDAQVKEKVLLLTDVPAEPQKAKTKTVKKSSGTPKARRKVVRKTE